MGDLDGKIGGGKERAVALKHPIVFSPEGDLGSVLKEALAIAPGATRVFLHYAPLGINGEVDWKNSHLVDMASEADGHYSYSDMVGIDGKWIYRIGVFCPLFTDTQWTEMSVVDASAGGEKDLLGMGERAIEVLDTPKWEIVEASVIGSSHKRQNLPNQDAVLSKKPKKTGDSTIIAVADGHGSEKYSRSDRGSRFAVEIAVDELNGFLGTEKIDDIDVFQQRVQTIVVPRIIQKWRLRVAEDLKANPLNEGDFKRLKARADGQKGVRELEADNSLAYGSTFECAASIGKYIVFIQLGDGDTVTVDKNKSAQVIFSHGVKDGQIGNETHSLCQLDAAERTKVKVMPNDDIILITLSTDGLSNSYGDQAGFLKFSTDCLDIGIQNIRMDLSGYLVDITKEGSGDDISVAQLWKGD